jgi:PTS system N-acetylgalactosamine-specific IIA component
MIGFLVTGHGNFATGLLSSVGLVAGVQEHLMGVDFLESYSTDDLKEKLLDAIEVLGKDCDEIMILTDLKGGSPFNVSVTIKMEQPEKSIEVLCGTNFPMILSGVFEREGAKAKDLINSMIQDGQSGMDRFVVATLKQVADEEDGI